LVEYFHESLTVDELNGSLATVSQLGFSAPELNGIRRAREPLRSDDLLRAPRPDRSGAQCDRDANPRDPHQARPNTAPTGIDWTRLSPEEMPILAELKRMTTSNA
jgi:hypothetical protein